MASSYLSMSFGTCFWRTPKHFVRKLQSSTWNIDSWMQCSGSNAKTPKCNSGSLGVPQNYQPMETIVVNFNSLG